MSATINFPARMIAVVGALFFSCLIAPAGQAQEATGPVMSSIVDLGEQRYQIGEIIVDREAQEFSVPGKILHLRDPLEYLAVTTIGMKEYESLLALTTTARDFNRNDALPCRQRVFGGRERATASRDCRPSPCRAL